MSVEILDEREKLLKEKQAAEPWGDELPSLELTANVPENRQNHAKSQKGMSFSNEFWVVC